MLLFPITVKLPQVFLTEEEKLANLKTWLLSNGASIGDWEIQRNETTNTTAGIATRYINVGHEVLRLPMKLLLHSERGREMGVCANCFINLIIQYWLTCE